LTTPTEVTRRLVAVFAADVEGYSRLMGADEVGTLKGLTERRGLLLLVLCAVWHASLQPSNKVGRPYVEA
jgi:class 3 adenylate cyclase